jgi:hypothetical protein
MRESLNVTNVGTSRPSEYIYYFFCTCQSKFSEIITSCIFQASKRQPGASGRLHRTVTGEWVWSSEEEGGESSDDEVRTTTPSLNF